MACSLKGFRANNKQKGRRHNRPLRWRWMWRLVSAGRLAAAGDADLFLQPFEADGADHNLLANHIAWRAVQAHLFGELEIILDRRLDLGVREILLDARGIVAGVLGGDH